MMPKQFAFIFLACLAIFLPVFVLRFWPFGFDSYYYLDIVCNGTQPIVQEPFLSAWLFQVLPCNVPFLLVLNFFLMLGCCVWASLLGEYFVPKKGWLSGIFVLASFVFVMSFFSIESEPFAYFLCLMAAWLWFSSKKESYIKKLLAIALVLLATQFWAGSFLMLAAFLLSSLFTIPILIAISLFFWRKILDQVLPSMVVQESVMGFGLLYQTTLLIAFLYLKHLKAIFVPTAFFILLAFINMKFAFFAAFFLAILAAKQATLREIGWLRFLPFVGVVLVTCFLWGSTAALPPSEYEIGAVQLAVEQADGNTICNQWGYGHLIAFFGGNPSDKAGGKQQCTICTNCTMLSFDYPKNCELLKGDLNNPMQIKVFKC